MKIRNEAISKNFVSVMEGSKSINILVISQRPLDTRMLGAFSLDELSARFNLQYWDVSGIINKNASWANTQKRDYAISISSKEEMECKLKKMPKDTIAIINTFKQYSTYKLHHLVGKYISCGVLIYEKPSFLGKCGYGNAQNLLNTEEKKKVSTNNDNRTHKLKKWLYKSELIQTIIKYIRYKGDYRFKQWRDGVYGQKCFNCYRYFFTIGMSYDSDYRLTSKEYDTIRKLEQNINGEKIEHNFIVFIDTYYPLHGDLKNRKPDFDWEALKQPYYDSLNRFFDKIEATYKCSVIIAAHPNADYTQNPFNGREIQQFKSLELTINAMAVLLHASSVVSMAIYYDKPMCIISNSAFKAGDFSGCFYAIASDMASALKMPLVNIDELDSVENVFSHIPEDIRMRFIDLYMGDATIKKPYIEQLSDALIDIHNRIK